MSFESNQLPVVFHFLPCLHTLELEYLLLPVSPTCQSDFLFFTIDVFVGEEMNDLKLPWVDWLYHPELMEIVFVG